MDYREVRRGVTQAEQNVTSFNVMAVEIVIIAIAIGLFFKSWWWGLGSVVGLIIGFSYRYIAMVLGFMLSIAWFFIGFVIGSFFGSLAAQIVLGIIAFIVGLGIHFSAIVWVEDMNGNY